jgi:hypothetical protein
MPVYFLQVVQAVNSAGATLDTVQLWIEQGGNPPRAALVELRRRIDALFGLDNQEERRLWIPISK